MTSLTADFADSADKFIFLFAFIRVDSRLISFPFLNIDALALLTL